MEFEVIDPDNTSSTPSKIKAKVVKAVKDLIKTPAKNRTELTKGIWKVKGPFNVNYHHPMMAIENENGLIAFIPCREDGTYNEANLKAILDLGKE
jgi:hypothetical protein